MEISKQQFENALLVVTSASDEVYESVLPAIKQVMALSKENLLGSVGVAAVESAKDGDLLMDTYIGYVSTDAFLKVFRQLDLVLTPTGFGIVSNDNVSPASKQRVDALEGQLRTLREQRFWLLVHLLSSYDQWGCQQCAIDAIENVYDGYFFFFGTNQSRNYQDWEAVQATIAEADDFLRMYISDAMMDEILSAYRCNDDKLAKFLPVIHLIRRFTEQWISGGQHSTKIVYRKMIQTMEASVSVYQSYINSTAYTLNHNEAFQNTKDSTAFIFNG